MDLSKLTPQIIECLQKLSPEQISALINPNADKLPQLRLLLNKIQNQLNGSTPICNHDFQQIDVKLAFDQKIHDDTLNRTFQDVLAQYNDHDIIYISSILHGNTNYGEKPIIMIKDDFLKIPEYNALWKYLNPEPHQSFRNLYVINPTIFHAWKKVYPLIKDDINVL